MRHKVLAAGALGCASVLAPGVASATDLTGVPNYKQSMTNICWATAVQIVAKKIAGSALTQCQYVNAGKTSTTCPNLGGTGDDITRALNFGGVSTPSVQSAPSVSSATYAAEISAGYPTLFNIGWTGGGYHQVVGFGYNSSSTWVSIVKIGYQSGNPNAWPPATGSYIEYRAWSNFLSNSEYEVTNMRYNLRVGGGGGK